MSLGSELSFASPTLGFLPHPWDPCPTPGIPVLPLGSLSYPWEELRTCTVAAFSDPGPRSGVPPLFLPLSDEVLSCPVPALETR